MRSLQRPPKSVAEIAALPPLGSTECSAHVRTHGESYTPETLVYLMREAILLRDTALFEICFKFLIGHDAGGGHWEGGHCERTIRARARSYGFHLNRDLRYGFRSRCLVAVSNAIHAGRETKPYWEERFRDAFKKSCTDVARSLRLPRNRDMEAGVTDDAGDGVDVDGIDPEAELIDAAVLNRLAAPHHEEMVLQAVRALPPRQGQAVLLAWLEDHAIEGQGENTVAKIMDVTPRAVYKHLEKALGTLRANPDLRAIWFGEA